MFGLNNKRNNTVPFQNPHMYGATPFHYSPGSNYVHSTFLSSPNTGSGPLINQPPPIANDQLGQGFVPVHHMNYVNHPTNEAQTLFQNPLQPEQSEDYMTATQMYQPYFPMHPYPPFHHMPKPAGGIHTLLNSFKGKDGTIDFNKMADTAGNMMNAVSQVSSAIKGFSSMFKA